MKVGMRITSVQLKNVAVTLIPLLMLLIVAAPSTHAQSTTIAQSFKANISQDDIVTGALVSTKGDQNTVELATISTANQLVGVVDGNSLVSLSTKDQQADIAFSGMTTVLVSDINGAITSGDKIAVSPIAGIGMRATTSGQIIGTALNNFKATANQSVNDRGGKSHTIRVGYVSAQIGVAAYQIPGSNLLPSFVQNAANSIAGRQVSFIRVLICSSLMVLGFIAAITLVYTSTRSAITSLGRNPLAASAIRRGLYQITALAILTIGGTLFVSYLALVL